MRLPHQGIAKQLINRNLQKVRYRALQYESIYISPIFYSPWFVSYPTSCVLLELALKLMKFAESICEMVVLGVLCVTVYTFLARMGSLGQAPLHRM